MKELTKIPTDKIDHQDKRFIFRAEKNSFSHELPMFLKESDTYIPLKEYDLDDKHIDAFVYGPDVPYTDIMKELIKDRELSLFDQAAIMMKLDEYAPGTDRKEWARILKINVNRWDDVKALVKYEKIWQKYFCDKHAPLKRVFHFKDAALRQRLMPLLTLNPGINILESIATLLIESANREKCGIEEIWAELGIDNVLEGSEHASALKLKTIRELLYSKRYPTIAMYRKKLDEHLKSIPRASGVDLRSDMNFETPGMRLSADLRSRQDIEDLQNWLEDQKTELEKIMDIQKGNEET